VTKISFKIINNGPAFRPRVQFFWYDDDTTNSIKVNKRGEWLSITEVDAGRTVNNFYSNFSPSFVTKGDDKETFKMVLINRETGTEIGRTTVTITVT